MLICIDLSALYFAIRDLSVTINYELLLKQLRKDFGDSCSVHAFTIANSKNVSQSKFLAKLQQLGVNLHVYPQTQNPNFTAEICTWLALSPVKSAIVISNDQAFIRPFEILEGAGKDLTLSFFSEKLHGQWISRVIANSVKFYDLSADGIKESISE
tara:strand:- start:157 stop:624 length:468 start_codon:yes stop_codon:yes gene_type:complete